MRTAAPPQDPSLGMSDGFAADALNGASDAANARHGPWAKAWGSRRQPTNPHPGTGAQAPLRSQWVEVLTRRWPRSQSTRGGIRS